MIFEIIFISAVLIAVGRGLLGLLYFGALSELRKRISQNYEFAAKVAKLGINTSKIQKGEAKVPSFWIIAVVTAIYIPTFGSGLLHRAKLADFQETHRARFLFTVVDAGTDLNPRIVLVDQHNVKWFLEFDKCVNTRILKKGATNWFVRIDSHNKWTGKSKSTIDNMQSLVCK